MYCCRLFQPHADAFGVRCKLDPLYITNFSEEVVRSQPVFMLSVLLRYLDPHLRRAADVGPWQVVSQAPAVGQVMVMEDLSGIQGKSFESGPSVVVLADRLTGNEDIPLGVQAVITASATDVLSHVAIRARAQGVLLATCFDADKVAELKLLDGQWVEAGVLASGDVGVTPIAAPAAKASGGAGPAGKKVKLVKAKKAASSDAWVLTETEFEAGAVGGKSRNLAALRGKLPASINVPSSIALPFGTFERVLADPANKEVAAAVAAAEKELASFLKTSKGSGVPSTLGAMREVIATKLVAPAALLDAASQAATAAGMIKAGDWKQGSEHWTATWSAICKVWASKWNDRAWLSRVSNDIPDADLSMAVLVQTVVPSAYAFVLHTADPLTGEAGALRGEMAVGMGEALVGNFPGRPLSFAKQELLGLPSKREALLPVSGPSGAQLLIARSDSNGEDLEDFAGAGLYSSVPVVDLEKVSVRYADEKLIWDEAFRTDLLKRVCDLGVAVEAAFGSPQDVEGAVDGEGKLFVVQSRAQV